MCIYRVLMNRDADNKGLVPRDFVPEYSSEEINSRQHLIAETTAHSSPFSVQLESFFRTLKTNLRYCFGFLSKIYV